MKEETFVLLCIGAIEAAVIVGLILLCSYALGAQTIDKKFFTVASFHAESIALDGITTANRVGTTHCWRETGSPWLYGRRPAPVRLSLAMAGEFAAAVTTAYVLKKKNARIGKFKLWPLPMVLNAVPHLVAGIGNERPCR